MSVLIVLFIFIICYLCAYVLFVFHGIFILLLFCYLCLLRGISVFSYIFIFTGCLCDVYYFALRLLIPFNAVFLSLLSYLFLPFCHVMFIVVSSLNNFFDAVFVSLFSYLFLPVVHGCLLFCSSFTHFIDAVCLSVFSYLFLPFYHVSFIFILVSYSFL